MLTLMVITGALQVFFYAMDWWTSFNGGAFVVWAVLFNLMWLAFGLLICVSCILLLLAVSKISNYVKSKSDDVNNRMLKVHAISFGVYLIIASLYFIFYMCKNLFHLKSAYYISAFIICVLLDFASQLCLCFIIHRLITANPTIRISQDDNPVDQSTHRSTTSTWDDRAEMHA